MWALQRYFMSNMSKNRRQNFHGLLILLCSCMNIVYMFVCAYLAIFIEISRWLL
jgi:hypothetical protein